MRKMKYFLIPASLFLLACGIFLSLAGSKEAAQLAFHRGVYSNTGETIMSMITTWGEGTLYAVVVIAFIFDRRWKMVFPLLTGAALSAVLVAFFKKVVFAPSPRPLAVLDKAELLLSNTADIPLQFAFPSGHTTTAFVLFTMLALFTTRKVIQVALVLCAILVGLSRVYLMAHWFTDIMAGAVLGMAIAWLSVWIWQGYQQKNPPLSARADSKFRLPF
jgi:membrane-associated phospholipid phosphatase